MPKDIKKTYTFQKIKQIVQVYGRRGKQKIYFLPRGRKGEPHISDLRTPLFAKLTSEPHISDSEPHIAAPNPTPLHWSPVSFFFLCNAFNCLTKEKSQKISMQLNSVLLLEYINALMLKGSIRNYFITYINVLPTCRIECLRLRRHI